MRDQRRWWGLGAVCGGVVLAGATQFTWSQSGDVPGARPPALPPATAEQPFRSAPVSPQVAPAATASPQVVLPALPMNQGLPPAPKVAEQALPPIPRAPESIDLLPRTDSLPSVPTLPSTALPANALPAISAPGAFTSTPSTSAPTLPVSTSVDNKSMARQEPSVSVEFVGPTTTQLNRPMQCQIVVRNTGPATVHQVTVRHPLKPGVTCKQSQPPAATESNDLVWSVGSLPPGQQRRLDLTLVASQRGALDCQATVSFSSVAGQTIQVREPLLLVKMKLPEKAVVGDPVNLLFAVANPGDGVTEQIKVKAILPDGLDSDRGRVVELDVGSLNPKETRTLQIACVARSSGSHKATLVATADGNLTSSDQAFTDILQARLDLAVTGPKLRYIDRRATYILKVSNPGTAPAQQVALNEVIPAGFKFHTASSGGRWDDVTKTISWQLGDLMPGQSREVAIELVAAAAGDHRLQANVTSTRGARTDATTQTRVEGSSSLVIELVDVDDPVEVGAETTYEIRISNTGTKTETNLELACTLPDQVEFKNAKSVAGVRHRLEGREIVFEPLPRLAPKADVIYRVTVRGTAAADVRFRARIRADGMPESVIREEVTRFYNDNVLPK